MSYEKTISRLCDLSKEEVFEFKRLVDGMRVRFDAESRVINNKTHGFGNYPRKLSDEYRELSLTLPVLEKMISKLE